MSIAAPTMDELDLFRPTYRPASQSSPAEPDGFRMPYHTAADWLPSIEASVRKIADECARADWGGAECKPITSGVLTLTVKVAEAIFGLLPRGTPGPDVVPEIDGEICLSWTRTDSRIFSISLGEHSVVNYSGILGRQGDIHGWQPIDITNQKSLRDSLVEVSRHVVKLYT